MYTWYQRQRLSAFHVHPWGESRK